MVFLLAVFAVLLLASWGIVAAFGTAKRGNGMDARVNETGEALSDTGHVGPDKAAQSAGEDEGAYGDVIVVTSFYPMYIAAMNLLYGVDGVRLYNLSEPQTGCLHDYQLVPSDMELLSKADVFIVNGGGMESFLGDVTDAYPDLAVIDTSRDIHYAESEEEHEDGEDEEGHAKGHEDGIFEHAGEADAEHVEEHGDVGEHEAGHTGGNEEHETAVYGHAEEGDAEHAGEHEEEAGAGGHHHHGINAHYWLSLPLYRLQVQTMAEGLKARMAGVKEESGSSGDAVSVLASNEACYVSKIDELILRQQKLRGLLEGRSVVTFFDGFAYIASDYGLATVYSMDLDEERQISAGEVAAVVKAVKSSPEGEPAILAEETYGSALAETVKGETGACVIYLDPLVRGSGKKDAGAVKKACDAAVYDKDAYIERMGENMDALERMAAP